MNSLHDLEISLVYYNDTTKKTCLIRVLDQNLFIFVSPKNARCWNDRVYITARVTNTSMLRV